MSRKICILFSFRMRKHMRVVFKLSWYVFIQAIKFKSVKYILTYSIHYTCLFLVYVLVNWYTFVDSCIFMPPVFI